MSIFFSLYLFVLPSYSFFLSCIFLSLSVTFYNSVFTSVGLRVMLLTVSCTLAYFSFILLRIVLLRLVHRSYAIILSLSKLTTCFGSTVQLQIIIKCSSGFYYHQDGIIFFRATSPSGPGPHHSRGF
jgi:hypothetical protein